MVVSAKRLLLVSVCLPIVAAYCAELSVADFGAVAGDQRVDTSAFVAAVEKAEAGDVVLVPEGEFQIDGQITLKSGLTVKGASAEKTRLVYVGEASSCFFRIKKAEDVEIFHLTLDGRNNPNAQQGIVVSQCNRVRLQHLIIENFVDTGKFGPHGILCSGASNTTISDNVIRNIAPEDPWGAGIRTGEPCSGNVIERNRIDNTGRGGIFTNNGAGDAIIRENIITRSHGIAFAIEVHSRSVRTVVEDNIVDHGLSIVSPNCAVRRNIVIDPEGTWASYGIEGGGGPDGVVTDNIIDYGQQQGISLSGSTHYMLWARNRFRNCSQWGIQIQGASEGKRISSLYFYKNQFCKMKKGHPSARYPGHDGNGIRFNNHAAYITFDSNRICDNGALGIQITSGKDVNHLSFIDNIITSNVAGVMSPYPGDTLLWIGNFLAGNGPAEAPGTKGDPGKPPVARMAAPEKAGVGQTVTFKSLAEPGSAPVSHVLWDFGAGVPSTEPVAEYVYERPGVYIVSLVVWDEDGRGSRPAEQTIRVSEQANEVAPRTAE